MALPAGITPISADTLPSGISPLPKGISPVKETEDKSYLPSTRLLNFLDDNEGFSSTPYDSPEGGTQTLGFGHKSKPGEKVTFISKADAQDLRFKDIQAKANEVRKVVPNFDDLSQNQKDMLVEKAYQSGSLEGWPKFTAAVVGNDLKTAAKEYLTYYTNPKGEKVPLLNRQKDFVDTFIQPKVAAAQVAKTAPADPAPSDITGQDAVNPPRYSSPIARAAAQTDQPSQSPTPAPEVPTGRPTGPTGRNAAGALQAHRTTRPQSYAEAENRPVGVLLSALEFVDRPRAAIAGAAISAMSDTGQTPGEAASKGIRGEQHPLFGDFIFSKLQEARMNPEAHPVISSIQSILGKGVRLRVPSADHWGFVEFGDIDPAKVDAATATIGGIMTDIAVDPVTYTGIGLTEKGAVATIKSSLEKAGLDIRDPALLAKISKYETRGETVELHNTIAQQLKSGQKRVRVAGVPLPGKVSGTIAAGGSKFANWMKAKPIGQSFDQAFNTKFGLTGGLESFGPTETKLYDVIATAKYESIRNGVAIKEQIAGIAKELSLKSGQNITPEHLGEFITEQVERAKLTSVATGVPVEQVVKSELNIKKQFRDKTKLWSMSVKAKIRPENLSQDTKALIAADPQINAFVVGLKTKNAQQIADEIKAGVRVKELGTGSSMEVKKISDAIAEATSTGAKAIKNPITGKMKSVEGLRKDLAAAAKKAKESEQLDYFVHAITPEAKAAVKKRANVSGGKEFSVQHASTLQRRYSNMSIKEINDAAKAGKLPGFEGQKIEKFFYDDPAVAQTLRDIRHRKAMAVADFIDRTKKDFGMSVEKLRKDAIKGGAKKGITAEEVIPAGYRRINNPKIPVGGYVFPKEIADRLESHYEALIDPQATGAFLKMYDGVQNWWKAWTLGIFPSYHVRNAAGNVWNNFITGTKDPALYGAAMNLQRGVDGVVHTIDGRAIPFEEIKRHLDILGIRNKGFIGTDIEQSIKAEMGNAKWLTLSKNSKAIYYGQKVGKAVEENARIAKFIDELKKGKSFQDAASSVQHALFDYQDLTHFEKKVAKRLAPFYTWSRKNIPLQVENIIKHPGKYKAIDTIRREVEANTQDPGEYVLPYWMLENYPTRVKMGEDGKPRYFMLGGWVPAADVWTLAANPIQLPLNLLTPIIKIPGEYMTNKDWFTHQDIKHYTSETVDYMGDTFHISPHTKKLLNNLRVLSVLDKMLPESYKGITPQTVDNQTPQEKFLQFMTGLRLYGIDLQTEKLFRAKETNQKINELGGYYGKSLLPQKQKPKREQEGLKKEINQQVEQFKNILTK